MFLRIIIFSVLLLLSSVVSGNWLIRVDISGDVNINVDGNDGWKVLKRPSGVSFRKDISSDSQECRIQFTPEADGNVVLTWRGGSGHEIISDPWLIISNISTQGIELKNPNFSETNNQGMLRNWKGKKENVILSSHSARISYSASLSQRTVLRKNIPVVINFRAKPEQLPQMDIPEWSNVVMDHVTNIQTLISSGRLECRPTFENCGIYVNRKKNEYDKDLKLKLYYRESGGNDWLPALSPVEIPQEHAWRGSIMMLKENTSYEVKGIISGEVDDIFTGNFKTLNPQVKIARHIEIDPDGFTGELKISESGTPDGYIRYSMKRGKTLKGNTNKQAVITLENASYIILEGLTIDGNQTPGGILILNSQHIRVLNCDIYNFGRVGVQRFDLNGQFYLDGKRLYYDPGIEIKNSKNILVERCFIHSPASTSNTWFYSHPTGPSALRVQNAEGVVLRYNDLVGNDKGRFIDVIHAPVNSHITGGFMRDSDIYGNLLIFANDDGIELEGGGMNSRFYFNRVEGTYSGVSTGVCRLGPIYQYRNLYIRPGDEEHRYGTPFKNSLGIQGYGAVYFINNTVAGQIPRVVFGSFHRELPVNEFKTVLKAFSRNNIVVSKNEFYASKFFEWRVDVDSDMMEILPPGNQEAKKLEFDRRQQELNGLYAAPIYMDADNGDFRLAYDSPGRNQAARLDNISCTHVGAFQDDNINFLPYRPLPLSANRQNIFFSATEIPLSQTFEVTVNTEDYRTPFQAHCNDDFFSVEPATGVFRSGKAITFKVTLHPDRMPHPRRYNGVILLRNDQGLSLPVTVYADYRGDQKRRREALKSAMIMPVNINQANRKAELEINVPEDGTYFLFTDAENFGLVKNIRAKIGDCDTKTQGRLLGADMRNGSFEYFPVTNRYLSAYYFKLKAGRQKLHLEINDFDEANANGKITRLLLTKYPKLFTW